MRLFPSWILALSSFVVSTTEGVIQLEPPKLPGSVVILGQGEIVNPDKWTDFPTQAPVPTNGPTPYPTPATPAPTPINYLLLEKGDSNVCPSGTQPVELDDCLDAGELVAAGRFNFPFYLDELDSDFTMPCGCFLRTKNAAGQKIVEYNSCEETTYYTDQGYGNCGDGAATYPSYFGTTSTATECEAGCTVIPDCIGYDWSSVTNCSLRFATKTIRDATPSISILSSTDDGCADGCYTPTMTGMAGPAATLYHDDNFSGPGVDFPTGYFTYPDYVAQGMQNDALSSLIVQPGYTAELYQHGWGLGWKAVFNAGSYTAADIIAAGGKDDDASSIRIYGTDVPTCMKKSVGMPPGVPNPDTQLICKLTEGIDAGVEDLSQWDKAYGKGTLAGGAEPSKWDPDNLLGEFYIRRTCPNCVDSHKNIIYKRLTPLPAGFNVEELFTRSWTSTDNVLNVDFKLYSSMSYALADLMPWSYCNYGSNVGFPRDCGPTGYVPYQWMTHGSSNGQQDIGFYVWHGNPASVLSEVGACVGTNPTECGCAVVHETDYRGTLAETASGHTCQAWSSQTPHAHSYTPGNYPDMGLESNYCRNPNDWSEGAWCFTTDPNVPWALCDVPDCFVPPYDHNWYKDYPYMPWHLPPWHITMNINPSDGGDAGWYSDFWTGSEDVGLDTQALSNDYKDFTSNWRRDFDCMAIARHDAKKIDGVKVWKMNEIKTFAEYFNTDATERVVVTTGGPVQFYLVDGTEIGDDPILSSTGPFNNLAFNWKYANNGARIVLTDVGNFNGELSCESCNDDATHGLGNDFLNTPHDFWHDASLIQGECFRGSCKVQGSDHGPLLTSTTKLGNYAIYVTMANPDGTCPEFLINNGNGNSLYNAGATLCTICDNVETPWMVSNNIDCNNAIDNQGRNMMETKCTNATHWVNNKYCQQSCYTAGNGYDGDNCCDVNTFEELGNFHCTTGYYAGWSMDPNASSMTVEKCKEICLSESTCDYFSVWPGNTCSRYNANSCEDAGTPNSPNHISYKKLKDV